VSYFSVDGGKPVARRQVIDQTKCNVCHMRLTMHGSIRQNVEYCVMCHNPTATDEAARPADAMPPITINFPVLVHRIHTGRDAAQPLQVFGFGGSLNDFSNNFFPGNRAACQTCHLAGTDALPLSTSIHPTTISQEGKVLSTILPVRAICTSCHDDAATNGHADLQTTPSGVETCLVCHGPNREADITKVHK
jgi:OmcA/MtrC family decaheme c-type cytochrome